MFNLLKLDDLSTKQVIDIIKEANTLSKKKIVKQFKNKIVANLFFENSTRTHYSFLVAEEKLGCKPIDFSVSSSSINKGETFHDTIKTFASFGIDALVIRDVHNE
jgi:aspartate carbamoyltransferase catalytic subunit